MWEKINLGLLIVEIVLLIWGISLLIRKENTVKTVVFLCVIALLNFSLYSMPWIYKIVEYKTPENVVLNILECVTCTIKQFVGEVRTEQVAEYIAIFPEYTANFGIGAVLAIMTTFMAAIKIFGRKIRNGMSLARKMDAKSCDIIVGDCDVARAYAKRCKNVVLMIDDSADKEYIKTLMGEGYTIMKKKMSAELLKSRYFNKRTNYNILYPNADENFAKEMNVIFSYLDSGCNKKIHFYLELDDKATEIIQNQIDKRESADDKSTKKKTYRQHITVFSRNELLARTFVDENPITRYMSPECFEADTSVKQGVKLNVFMLGFGALSKELYKQFVINNQLATKTKGEYRVHPLNYYIYDSEADSREWIIDGLEEALTERKALGEMYFTIPDLPYETECISESLFGIDCLNSICSTVKKDSMSYIIIDTGDVYRNLAIGEKLNLLLDGFDNFHIFIHNESLAVKTDENITCYGNLDAIFTHDVIVNESLVELAKEINNVYERKKYEDNGKKCTTEILEQAWKSLKYFTVYSNIYNANNIRLKLNLLGLDYVKDGKGEGVDFISVYSEGEKTYEKCFEFCQRSALLAQEHYRWNAYHMMNGYIPLKKERIVVTKNEEGSFHKKTDKVKVVAKQEKLKKHACLTTYKGLDELSGYIAQKANEILPDEYYEARDFEYYANDGMLLEIVPAFFRAKGYSVYRRSNTEE